MAKGLESTGTDTLRKPMVGVWCDLRLRVGAGGWLLYQRTLLATVC